jgi:hypothetical protein
MIKYCAKCQVETERHARGQCSQCVRVRNAVWGKANREYKCAATAAWVKANPERSRAATIAWAKANPERYRATTDAWQKANPERKKAITAAWGKANPETLRIYCNNYRAKKLANGGKLSKGLSAKLFKLQQGKCPCCSQPLGDDYHMDHITPLKKGGANEDWNIQLLRQQCNNQKHAKDPIDFMQSRGFLI